MDDTEFVDLEVDLTRFHLLNGLADFHRNRTGLGVRHQAAGTQNTAQRTDLTHYVRRTDDHVDVSPAGLDLVDILVQAYVIGAGSLCFGLLFGSTEHEHPHLLTRTVGQRHNAAHHLVGLAGVNAQADVDINGRVEFRERNFLQKSGGLRELVSLSGFHLSVGDLLIFCQLTHLRLHIRKFTDDVDTHTASGTSDHTHSSL